VRTLHPIQHRGSLRWFDANYITKTTAARQGYKTVALVRSIEKALSPQYSEYLSNPNTTVRQCDVTSEASIESVMSSLDSPPSAIISCLASRTGTKKDSFLIDYGASSNLLKSARAYSAHYTLLSAFCCKNPWLQFQQAKLKVEAEIKSQMDSSWSIVRPTAFFKSVSGQLEVIQSGAPFVMFGDGCVTRCNPISEFDLAKYLVDSISDKSRHSRIIDLGGPDEPLTMKKQGELLFSACEKKEFFVYAPLWLFDVIIDALDFYARWFQSEAIEDAAELARIGKYYAVEDMLTTGGEGGGEKYGTMTLKEHYEKIAVEGQEYDPYTTVFGSASSS